MNIDKYIKASNNWIKNNRKYQQSDLITLSDIDKRFKSSSSLLSIEADAKTVKGTKTLTVIKTAK